MRRRVSGMTPEARLPTDHAALHPLQAIADGDFGPVPPVAEDFARMAQLVAQYEDPPVGTTDASAIALAERLGIAEIATLDQRPLLPYRAAESRRLVDPVAGVTVNPCPTSAPRALSRDLKTVQNA